MLSFGRDASDQDTNTTQQPVVIRQAGNGLGPKLWRVLATVIYAINVCLTTKKKSPAKNIDHGIERIEDAAGKEIDSRNYPAASAMLRAGLPQETPAFSFDSEALEFPSLDSPA